MTPRRWPLFAAILLVIATGSPGARAACTTSRFFLSFGAATTSYVHTPGACAEIPCGAGETSVTADLEGVFWRLGFGDPVLGVGIDNGSFPSLDGYQDGWVHYVPGYFAYLYGDWAEDPRIDGCIDGPAPPHCMAVALGDQLDGTGYFAVLTAAADAATSFDFLQPDAAPIELAPIPRPAVVGSTVTPDGILLTVLPDSAPDAGLYLDGDPCALEIVVGYRVYQRTLAPGEASSADRRLDTWTPAEGGSGPDGAPLPLGSAAQVLYPGTCGATVLALTLAFESGFETPFVSADSVRIDANPFCTDLDCDGWCGFAEAPEVPLDCDDDNPDVYPGAPQICDGLNNDCDAPDWPSVALTNEAGEDFDGDGLAGRCDNCPLTSNPPQTDADADGRGDACDNCLLAPNPGQGDADADGEGDVCDLDDGLIWLVTAEPELFEWQLEQGLGPWNLYRGDLGLLRTLGLYTQEPGTGPLARRECGQSVPALVDTDVPDPGQVAHYLATSVLPAGETGLGLASDGTPRPNANPCPQ
jgi:hypothetical protein